MVGLHVAADALEDFLFVALHVLGNLQAGAAVQALVRINNKVKDHLCVSTLLALDTLGKLQQGHRGSVWVLMRV